MENNVVMMKRSNWIVAVLATLGALTTSCGAVNVAGNFTGIVTNGENACAIANWTVGTQYRNITLGLSQSNTMVTATVDGALSTALSSFTSSNDAITGVTTGDGFVVRRAGFAPMTRGNCSYKAGIDIEGTVNGNTLTGTVTYHYTTNNMSDCAELQTCRSVQQLAFTRVM